LIAIIFVATIFMFIARAIKIKIMCEKVNLRLTQRVIAIITNILTIMYYIFLIYQATQNSKDQQTNLTKCKQEL
jgi:hypothetical protein